MTLTRGERICAGIVVGEITVTGWCVWLLYRTYRTVKGKCG